MNPSSPATPGRHLSLLPLLLLLAAGGLQAETPMAISLSGGAEVPAVISPASGSGRITIKSDRSISGSIKVAGMAPTMAHIHEGAVGMNGPPIITLNQGLDSIYAVPAGARLSQAQYASFAAGKLYINVHSARYPAGEIRAQLPARPMRLAY